jgi:hypothetical protein
MEAFYEVSFNFLIFFKKILQSIYFIFINNLIFILKSLLLVLFKNHILVLMVFKTYFKTYLHEFIIIIIIPFQFRRGFFRSFKLIDPLLFLLLVLLFGKRGRLVVRI